MGAARTTPHDVRRGASVPCCGFRGDTGTLAWLREISTKILESLGGVTSGRLDGRNVSAGLMAGLMRDRRNNGLSCARGPLQAF